MFDTLRKTLKPLAVAATVIGFSAGAQAGSIYLTGHDVLLHGGQSGYDGVILDYLRGAGTSGEIAKSSYNIAVVGSGVGSASFTGGGGFTGLASGSTISASGTLADYGVATYYRTGTGADWSAILAADALVILSHTNCGGCDLSTAGSAEVNSNAAAIAAAFNSGLDIWGLSSATLATYYEFLPPSAVATGASISGSTGFTATTEGAAIGITSSMINGHPTHNRFTSHASAFTVMEERGSEIISIGLQDGSIGDDGTITVPEPATAAIFGVALMGLGYARRKRAA